MIFKKWVSLMTCALTVLLMFGMTVSAAPADTMVFTMSVTEGDVGDTVTVSVSISENSYFTNTTFYLHYDSSKVSYVKDSLDVGKASPSGKAMFDALDHPDKNFVKGAYVTISGIKKAGELIKMDFKVLDAAPAAFSLSFDECVGVDENDVEFDVNYRVEGCVLNNDGTVETPTGDPVVIPTTASDVVTTTSGTANSEVTTTTVGSTTVGTTAATLPTMVVTDEGNNKITIPVVTTTDASGNVATVPVAVVTDAQGATVTVPVVIVTDTAGSVATIPVADGTDANGNDVTIPVAIVTDDKGNVETVPVATATDSDGKIVTVPVETFPVDYYADSDSGATTAIVIVAVCVIVAVAVAVVAVKLRKKNEE